MIAVTNGCSTRKQPAIRSARTTSVSVRSICGVDFMSCRWRSRQRSRRTHGTFDDVIPPRPRPSQRASLQVPAVRTKLARSLTSQDAAAAPNASSRDLPTGQSAVRGHRDRQSARTLLRWPRERAFAGPMESGHSMGKFTVALTIVTVCCALSAAAQPTTVFPPLAFPGPYPVACSNVTQDFTRLAPGEDVQAYWEGVARADGSPRYITDLLADARDTLIATVQALPRQRRVRLVRRAKRSLRHHRLLPDRGGQPAARLPAAEREIGAAHAARGRSPAVARCDDAVSRAAVLAWLPRQPDVERLYRCAGAARELRLCRRRALSRRRPIRDAATRKPHRPAVPDPAFARLPRDAGAAPAVAVGHTRLAVRRAAMARPPRSRGRSGGSARVSAENRCC